MPVQVKYEPNDIYVLRISGILKRCEFAAEQSNLARDIDTGAKPRLLIILENFEGWECGADWGYDLDFFFCIAAKFRRSRSSASRAGKRLLWRSPGLESGAPQ